MDRKFSSLNDLDEDFLLLQQKSSRQQIRGAGGHLLLPGGTRKTSLSEGFKNPSYSYRRPSSSVADNDIPLSITPFVPAIVNDDLQGFSELTSRIENVYAFFAEDICHLPNGMNVFHLAVEANAAGIIGHLITNCKSEFLMEAFTTQVDNFFSKKTALHMLVEEEKTELVEKLIDKINDAQFWTRHDYLICLVKIDIGEGSVRPMSALHIAALKGNVELIKLLIKSGVQVDISNDAGETPLMWAVWANRLEAVKALVASGASPNHEDAKGSTAFYRAIRHGFTDVVSYLLSHGKANVNQRRRFGLILPLTLASAMGHLEIVRILLHHGALINTTITGGKSALHYASTQGHDDIIKLLLSHRARIDQGDANGNTPLMLATKEGKLHAINALLSSEASMEHKNQLGQTVWDFAVTHSDLSIILVFVIRYKKTHGISTDVKFTFPKGRTPLHIAAVKGTTAGISHLLDLGVEWKCSDDMGNTFLHTAAQSNCVTVLEEFAATYDITQQNDHGETALHLAVKNGHMKALNILLQKSTLGIQNSTGSSPLHLAAWSPKCSPEVASVLVEAIIASNRWALLDAKDKNGNTALHVAAKKGRIEIIEVLQPLDPRAVNDEGDNALHVAAKAGDLLALEMLLSVFGEDVEERGSRLIRSRFDLDQPNSKNDTVLHICSRMGEVESVRSLLQAGAGLALMNHRGNTVLHDVTEQIVLKPNMKEAFLKVYNTLVELSSIWWCKTCGFHPPDEDSPLVATYRRDAMVHLTSEIYNNDNRTVITHSAAVGATIMLETILNSPGIYRFQQGPNYVFDITNLTPDTEIDSSATQRHVAKNGGRQSKINKMIGTLERPQNGSCLDIVAHLKNEVEATKMLDITPFRQLVKNYWSAYQLVFGFCMLSHIIFMSFFTKFGIETLIPASPMNFSVEASYIDITPTVYPQILLLIWPTMVLIFEMVYMVNRLHQTRKSKKETLANFFKGIGEQPCNIPSKLLSLTLDFVSHFSGVFFTLSVFIWFFMYELTNNHQAYALSVALMIGWMFTISFAKGFQSVHSFSIMLRHIFIRDIARFIFIYSFVMFGFAMGFHALFQLVPTFSSAYPSAWDTFFLTFNLMLGLDDSLFEDAGNFYYTELFCIKLVYACYVLLSSVILLNLLIAMMTETYANVFAKEGTTWKLGSVRLALKMEKSVPFLKIAFKKLGIIQDITYFDPDSHHWMMALPRDHLQENQIEDVDSGNKAILRLENRIMDLQTNCQELTKHIETMKNAMELLRSERNADDAFPVLKPPGQVSLVRRTSLQAAVQRWRERVHSVPRRSSSEDEDSSCSHQSNAISEHQEADELNQCQAIVEGFVSRWRQKTQHSRYKASSGSASVTEASGGGYINFAIDEESEPTMQTHI